MAVPWPRPSHVLLALASLCFFVSLSHGRILVPGLALLSAEVHGSQPQRNSHLHGVFMSDSTPGLEESSLSSAEVHGSQPQRNSHLHGVFMSDSTPGLEESSLSSAKVHGSPPEPNSHLNGVFVLDRTPPVKGDGKSSSLGVGKIVRSRIGDTDSHRPVSTFQGKKRRMLGKIAEWVLHTCVVLLAAFAIFYAVSCVCACCIGLDILAEIWRSLGGCQALRALLSYFVSTEKAVAEDDAEPLLA